MVEEIEILHDEYVHKFKIMNGNYTLCNEPYRVIDCDESRDKIIRRRKISKDIDDVNRPQCIKKLK